MLWAELQKKYLVEYGADINQCTFELLDDNAVCLAAKKGHLNLVKYLVENGTILKNLNKYDFTPSCFAASNGHVEIVKYFVDNNNFEK